MTIVDAILSNSKCLNTEIYFNKRTTSSMELSNGNKFDVFGDNVDYLRGYKSNTIIVDNAAFINRLEEVIKMTNTIKLIKDKPSIILASANNINENYFNKLFLDENNMFVKRKILWNQNPKFTNEWYSKLTETMVDEHFKAEIDLVDFEGPIGIAKTKDRIINVRIDDDLMSHLTNRLVERDLSLSDYIRTLIKNDSLKN